MMVNFHGSTGYGQDFIDAINGNWGGAPYEDLMMGLDYAEKNYLVHRQRPRVRAGRELRRLRHQLDRRPHGPLQVPGLARWHVQYRVGLSARPKSSGSTSGSSRALRGPTARCIASGRHICSPKNFKTPMLVVHGQLDYRLDVSEGFQLFTTLQRLKDSVKDALLPRRRPLGAEAAERRTLVQNSERLGGSVDQD